MTWVEPLVIWADASILVVNKPAGLATLPDGYDRDKPYLAGQLKQVYPALWIVHRLDKDTSGVLVFARTAQAHRELNSQFEMHQVTKVYHALVCGMPPWVEKTASYRLRPNGDRKHRTIVDAHNGKEAITELRALENLGEYTLVEATPRTGRTHQIRAHLAALGYPILWDALYNDPNWIAHTNPSAAQVQRDLAKSHQAPEHLPIHRLALHARYLTLKHPETGETISLEAAIPDDFADTIKLLKT